MNNTSLLLNTELEFNNLNYDSIGAIIFIVVVLLWYSSILVFLLGMQIISPREIVEDSLRHSKLLTQNFREKTNKKKILEELADKERRDKLWNIYLGTSGDMNDKIIRAETLRIRHIQRRLAAINEHYQDDYVQMQFINNENSFHCNIDSSSSDISSFENRLRVRRQSSMDQQILEEWKATFQDLKIRENWPWTIQKLLIRRYLRRQRQMRNDQTLRKRSIP